LDNAAVNPNQPSTVTPSVLLTSTEVTMGYVVGGDLSRFEGLFTQQTIDGVSSRQFNVYAAYIFSTTDFNSSWVNLYAAMYNFQDLRTSAIAKNYNAYAGIAYVLEAATAGYTTDVYGDIPFSQALQGSTNLQPKADAQKDVYASIQSLLDSGIARLGAANPGNLVPGTDDLVYGGSLPQWTRLAYSLKSRYYLHLRKVDNTAVAKAVAAAANGLASNSDDAYVKFGNSSGSASPWAQFSQQRNGELSFINGAGPVNSTLIQNMITNNDPRLNGFIDTATADNSYDEPQGFFGNYTVNNGNVAIMTYAEQLFINAELDSVQGNKAQAATDYNAAVTASVTAFTPSGVSSAAYLAANANATAATINLNMIMTQKWIALFLNPESFTDWRRTGYPVLTTNVPGTSIPRRFLYPQQEIAGNSNISTLENTITLQSHVWWDQ
jgi:hypothetical protein